MNILYIDDDQRDIELFQLKARLLDPSLKISSANTSSEALELVSSQKFDGIVADFRLDNEDGLQLLTDMRAQGVTSPIVFFTGMGNEAIASEALRRGASDYFVKDFETDRIQLFFVRLHQICERGPGYIRTVPTGKSAEGEQGEHWRIFSETTREGLVIHDNGIIIDLNTSFASIIGIPREKLIGRDARELAESNYLDLVDQNIFEERAEPYEVKGVRADGTPFTVEIEGKSIESHGKRYQVVALRDITLQHKAEQDLREKTEKLEAFNSMVSHDLRTPLWRIATYADMIESSFKKDDFETAQHAVSKMRDSVAQMMDLIANLLTYSRIKKEDLTRETINLSLIAKDAIATVNELYPDKEAIVEIDDGITAEGDVGMLSIVLENLFNNARKYSSHKSQPEVHFGVNITGEKAVYFVKDNGTGFPPEKKEELFTPFRRLHSEDDFSGTGVGLATVKRIIEMHNGRVWAESEPGKGATFFFTLG